MNSYFSAIALLFLSTTCLVQVADCRNWRSANAGDTIRWDIDCVWSTTKGSFTRPYVYAFAPKVNIQECLDYCKNDGACTHFTIQNQTPGVGLPSCFMFSSPTKGLYDITKPYSSTLGQQGCGFFVGRTPQY
jgi:hypothetical protein